MQVFPGRRLREAIQRLNIQDALSTNKHGEYIMLITNLTHINSSNKI